MYFTWHIGSDSVLLRGSAPLTSCIELPQSPQSGCKCAFLYWTEAGISFMTPPTQPPLLGELCAVCAHSIVVPEHGILGTETVSSSGTTYIMQWGNQMKFLARSRCLAFVCSGRHTEALQKVESSLLVPQPLVFSSDG